MPENFVSRWVRLKRSAEIRRNLERSGNEAPVKAVAPDGARGASGQHQAEEIIEEPFDLASLPSVETITVSTDIRGFLQSRVPVELTRAALRRAWASDPAIRDFIGIAENQWDFNDPTALPGFGPLQQGDNLPALLAQALGRPGNFVGSSSEKLALVQPSSPAAAAHDAGALDQNVRQTLDGSSAAHNINSAADADSAKTRDAHDGATEATDPPRRHSHGSALPRGGK